jgi:hypothetical protein
MNKAYPNDASMVKYCLSGSKWVELDNGVFVSACKAKPVIKNQMWYDDTKNNPGNSFEVFEEYNRSNMPTEMTIEHSMYGWSDTLCLCPASWRHPEAKLYHLQYMEAVEENQHRITTEELLIINEAIREVQADYTKRLEAYYKKYSSKIHSSGYWVDR